MGCGAGTLASTTGVGSSMILVAPLLGADARQRSKGEREREGEREVSTRHCTIIVHPSLTFTCSLV